MGRVSGVLLLLLLTGCMATFQDGTVLAPGAIAQTVGFEVIDMADISQKPFPQLQYRYAQGSTSPGSKISFILAPPSVGVGFRKQLRPHDAVGGQLIMAPIEDLFFIYQLNYIANGPGFYYGFRVSGLTELGNSTLVTPSLLFGLTLPSLWRWSVRMEINRGIENDSQDKDYVVGLGLGFVRR